MQTIRCGKSSLATRAFAARHTQHGTCCSTMTSTMTCTSASTACTASVAWRPQLCMHGRVGIAGSRSEGVYTNVTQTACNPHSVYVVACWCRLRRRSSSSQSSLAQQVSTTCTTTRSLTSCHARMCCCVGKSHMTRHRKPLSTGVCVDAQYQTPADVSSQGLSPTVSCSAPALRRSAEEVPCAHRHMHVLLHASTLVTAGNGLLCQ